jgi:hypothetical protein
MKKNIKGISNYKLNLENKKSKYIIKNGKKIREFQ